MKRDIIRWMYDGLRVLSKIKCVKLSFVFTIALSTIVLCIVASDNIFLSVFSSVDSNIIESRAIESYDTPRLWTSPVKTNQSKVWDPASNNFTKTPNSSSDINLNKFLFLSEHVINPHDYKNLISPTVKCNDHQEIDLIICVPTRGDNFEGRKTIRETWGSNVNESSFNLILIFFIGIPDISSPNASLTQKLLFQESVMYGDILQEDYLDSYNNLSLKSVSILKYASIHCSEAKYILKADDDMYINVPYLVNILRRFQITKPKLKTFVMGSKQIKAQPMRSIDSKWYTSISEYPEDTYPDYVIGAAYVMSTQASWLLFEASLRLPLFLWEDVYITGMCSKKAGVEVIDNSLFSWIRHAVSGCSFKRRISGHPYSLAEVRVIHRELYDKNIICK
ncbi:beta-1,3-galactosyltransferase 1-like [Physella acuta]|uniref:beta-1,3-galactosyltransferase 1-like n=1 Tax=Physella acuta TaxID=109671 RepID=UPI0027DCC38D|nr:beta-1,3-galactosyltransferase 1-like [Physella acuta]